MFTDVKKKNERHVRSNMRPPCYETATLLSADILSYLIVIPQGRILKPIFQDMPHCTKG
jgi:hypothetical protein